jgi:hypothetical protein
MRYPVAVEKRLCTAHIHRVQVGRGLVEQQNPRSLGEQAEQREALALTTGQATDLPAQDAGIETQGRKRLNAHYMGKVLPDHSAPPLALRRQHADVAAPFGRKKVLTRDPIQENFTRMGIQIRNGAQEERLASARGPR